MPDDDEDVVFPDPTIPMITVYDLEGNANEMTRINAHDMVTHLKWSYASPIVRIVEAPQSPTGGAGETAPAAIEALRDAEAPPDAPTLPEVEDMDREALLEEAGSYDIPNLEDFSDDDLRVAVIAERD